MRDPLTIFIPVTHYDRKYLLEAVASVFGQSTSEWYLQIVVPSDRTSHFEALLADSLRDPRVRIVPLEGRLLAGAYNTAMRAASSKFIAPLLGDDLWADDAVETLLEAIAANPDVDFFHSGRRFIDGDGRALSSSILPKGQVTRARFIDGSPVKHLLCWRVSAGLACGGVDETIGNFASDDYDFPWTMFEHGAAFHAIPRALYIVRDHRDGYRLTTHLTRSEQRRGLRRILAKHGVPAITAWRRVRRASRTYMRQSLFRNRLHQWVRERLGMNMDTAWREPYR